ELEQRAVQAVGARLGDGADDAAGRAPELRAVIVRLDAEFLDRVDAEQHAGHARRRLVGHVGDVGALEEVPRHLRPRAADGELRVPEAAREVARRGAADRHARLQRGELHEAPAVQRQLGDLGLGDDASGRGAAQLDVGRRALDAHLLGERSDSQLKIRRHVTADLQLRIGALAEQVSIEGAATNVELSSAAAGGVVSQTQIAELPLNGRSFMQLATLQPGVTVSRATARDFTGGFGNTQLSIGGARPEMTGYLLEGTNIADVSDKAPSSMAGVLLGVDAVKEFSVQTHDYSAEFGRAAGGVISAVTKSGTNSLHGTLFEFLRDSKFDAPNYFDQIDAAGTQTVPPFTRNQFGGTAGGPIVQNKLF